MTASDVQGASRPSRRLILVCLAIWVVLAFGLPLAALTLNVVKVGGFQLGFLTTAMVVPVALAALAWVFQARAGGDRGHEGVVPSLRLAADLTGAAGVVGFTGAIAALGYDGLAFPLGLVAGLVLLALIVAPRFSLYPSASIAGFLSARYGGVWARRLALMIIGLVTVLLLAADLRGGGLALQGMLSVDYATGVAVMTVALAAIWLARALVSKITALGFTYAVVLLTFLITLVAYARHLGFIPAPHLIYGYALEDLAALEQKLIVNKLADYHSLKPMSAPFLQLSMSNFAGLVIGIALGVATLPHILGRFVASQSVSAGEAPRRVAFGVVWLVAFTLGIVALAVFERLAFAEYLSGGIETAALPQTLVQASGLGWVKVCGVSSLNAADLSAACSKASGQRGFLRLQDLSFSNDAFVLAAPWISGLTPVAWVPLWIGALVAALGTGHAIMAGFLAADAEGRRSGSVDARALDMRSVVLAVLALFVALTVAMLGQQDIATLIAEALALLASGLFPALVLGLFWRRMTGRGAIAAMIAGFGIAALYIVGVKGFPVPFFSLTGALSDAAPSATKKFADLQATLLAASNDDMRMQAQLALTNHASTIVNWWGLKPGAAALLGLPVGLLIGIIGSLAVGKPVTKAERDT